MSYSAQHKVRANYNRLSRWYDLLSGSSERQASELGLSRLNVQPGERVLEIGFGTGRMLPALAQAAGPPGMLYGLDLSEKMVARGVRRIRQAGLASRVQLACGDTTRLPFKSDFLDVIFTSFMLEILAPSAILAVLNECRRVLRNDGRLAIVCMSARPCESRLLHIYTWAQTLLPGLVDCHPIQVQPILVVAGYRLLDETPLALWGLPVDVVTAQPEA